MDGAPPPPPRRPVLLPGTCQMARVVWPPLPPPPPPQACLATWDLSNGKGGVGPAGCLAVGHCLRLLQGGLPKLQELVLQVKGVGGGAQSGEVVLQVKGVGWGAVRRGGAAGEGGGGGRSQVRWCCRC